MSWRDLRCGEPRTELVGERLTLAGWVDTRRDHGGLVFVDLRDHTGVCQLVVNPEHAPDAIAAAHEVRNEFVLHAEGEIVERAPENVNPDLPTGAIELRAAGVRADADYAGRSVKGQRTQAGRLGAKRVIDVGPDTDLSEVGA